MTSIALNSDIHSDLTEYVLKLLHKNRITTVFEFAKTDSDRLMRITNLSFENISAVKNELINRFSGNTIQVVEYFHYLNQLVEPITTEIRGLDLLLEGGLLPGHILEICGESSSGKTQLCTTVAVNVSLRHKLDVLYADTKCDFFAKRVEMILSQKNVAGHEIPEIMGRIKVARFFTPECLIGTLEELLVQVDNMEKFKVLIIDSLPSLWYLHQNAKSNCYALGMLTRLIGLLRKLASENLIAVVLVNLKISSSDSFTQSGPRRASAQRGSVSYPALGKFWETAPTTRILISKIDGNETGQDRIIGIWKCNYLKTGDRQMIRITDAGVV